MNKFADYFYPRQPLYSYYTYYDYLVVIDFEATCDNTRNENPRPIRHERPEIIQFPAILVNVRTMEVDGIFNNIVKPVEAPVLSDFCTCLTGITQSMVKKASTFPSVLRRFEAWLKSHGLALNNQEYGHSFAIVTDGSYDMGHFLYKQCLISQIPYPSYASRWVNIRTIFTKVYQRRWICLKAALEFLGLPFEGRAHNGLDDSKNICKILMQLLRAGCLVYQTEKILLQAGEQERNEERILSDKSAGKYDLATVAPITSKEYEHICVYTTDGWSTHRTVPPESSDPSVESAPEVYVSNHSNSESSATINSGGESGFANSPFYQTSTSGSCESISSACSNKENSIPFYIPSSPGNSSVGSSIGKTRTLSESSCSSASMSDVPVVSANGLHGDVHNGSGGTIQFTATRGKAGRRKKRNMHLKDSSTTASFLKSNGTENENVVVKSVGTQTLNGSGGCSDTDDVSTSHSHFPTKASLETVSTQTAHLQLVSDLRTEE